MFRTVSFGRPITPGTFRRLDMLIMLFLALLAFILLTFTTPARAAQCNTYFLTDRVGQLSFPFCPPDHSPPGPGLIDNMAIGQSVPAPGSFSSLSQTQGTPATQNATGTLTAAQLATGIITSTSAAAVAATLPLGTAMDTANPTFGINTSFDFFVINTGPSARVDGCNSASAVSA